mmetsp:Transcript_88/g.187  ORF Transcript_88/g.187 Transcript_88/m.187 type:complete len:127 (+) Transcript_88:239-619(+)
MIGSESIGAHSCSLEEADDASDLLAEGAGGYWEVAAADEDEAYSGHDCYFSPGDVEHYGDVIFGCCFCGSLKGKVLTMSTAYRLCVRLPLVPPSWRLSPVLFVVCLVSFLSSFCCCWLLQSIAVAG